MPQPFNDAVMTNGGASLLSRAQAKEDIAERVAHGSITEDDYRTITGEGYEG